MQSRSRRPSIVFVDWRGRNKVRLAMYHSELRAPDRLLLGIHWLWLVVLVLVVAVILLVLAGGGSDVQLDRISASAARLK
jgi:hypothetical protein